MFALLIGFVFDFLGASAWNCKGAAVQIQPGHLGPGFPWRLGPNTEYESPDSKGGRLGSRIQVRISKKMLSNSKGRSARQYTHKHGPPRRPVLYTPGISQEIVEIVQEMLDMCAEIPQMSSEL